MGIDRQRGKETHNEIHNNCRLTSNTIQQQDYSIIAMHAFEDDRRRTNGYQVARVVMLVGGSGGGDDAVLRTERGQM